MILHNFSYFLFPSPFLWIDIYRVFLEHRGQIYPDTICFLRFFCIIYFYEINKSPASFFSVYPRLFFHRPLYSSVKSCFPLFFYCAV